MENLIDIRELILEKNLEHLLEHFEELFPRDNKRIIREIVRADYNLYKRTHNYQKIKKILTTNIYIKLAIHRECYPIKKEDNIIPFPEY